MESNDKFIKSTLSKYMFPTIFTIAWTTAISFVNNILVGKYLGAHALIGVNIVNSIIFLFFMLGCLINIGSSAVASVALGRENYKLVGKYEMYALISSIVFSMILSAVLMCFYEPLMHMMGANGKVYDITAGYGMIMIIFGFVITVMYFPFNFLRLDGRNLTSVIVFGIMFILDIALVYGGFLMGKGLTWVAVSYIASVAISDVIGCILLMHSKKTSIKPVMFNKTEMIRFTISVFKMGSSAGLNNLCNMGRTMLMNIIIIHYMGHTRAAAFAVVCSLIYFTSASVSGCGQTVAAMVGIFIGERDLVSIEFLMKNATKYAIIIHVIIATILIVFAENIAMFFGVSEASMIQVTSYDIRVFSVSLILGAVLNVFIYYYMTLGKNDLAIVVTVLRSFFGVVLFSTLFALIGYPGLYAWAFLAAEIVSLGVMVLMCRRYYKGKELSKFLLLPKYKEDKNMISFSVAGSSEGAVEASEKMALFCEDNDVDMKLSMTLPLSLEEIIVVMKEHCELGKKDTVDVRILMTEEGVLMRLRCGGKIFDPVAWYRDKLEKMTPEELLEDDSLGIRMITKKAKFVNFSRAFGVNNIIVGI